MAKQLNVNLAFTADTSQAEANLRNLRTTLNSIAATDTAGLSMDAPIQKAITAAKDLQRHLNNSFDVKTGNLNLDKFQASLTKSGQSLKMLSSDLLKSGMVGEQAFLQLSTAISSSNIQIKQAQGLLANLWTTMKNTARWQLSSTMLHGFIGSVQKAYGYTKDLNESLNNIRIVTGHSVDEMAKFAQQANKAAKELSATTTEYTNASLIYYQQGLSDEEVKARTDVTIKMANAAGESAEKVSDQLTAVWNNFAKGGENLEYYADVMTALGAATASSTDEIAAGLEKFAAIAETVGLSYEYATASLATITATTRQSADVVGNALKTLFARIQGLKLGETLEDGVDLNKYSQALNAVGVDVLTANGELRNMDDILNDLAAKWDTLGKAEQTALAQTVAGVRQYTQLVALMDNWDFMKENLQVAYNAEGTLQNQADIYAESWEAARDRTRAAFEDLYNNVLDDKVFIQMTESAGDLVSAVASVAEGFGGMKGVLLLISTIATQAFSKNIGNALDVTGLKIKDISNNIVQLGQNIKSMGAGGLKTLFYNTNQVGISKGDGQTKFQQDYLSSLQSAQNGNVTAGFKDQVQSLEQITRLQNQIDANTKNLTSAEREKLSIQLQQVQALSAQKAEIKDQIELNRVNQQNLINQDAEDFYRMAYSKNGSETSMTPGMSLNSGIIRDNLQSLIQMLGGVDVLLSGASEKTQLIVAEEETLIALRAQAIDQYSAVNTVNTQINAVLQDSSLKEEEKVARINKILQNEELRANISQSINDIYGQQVNSTGEVAEMLTRANAQARQMGETLNVSNEVLNQARVNGQILGENLKKDVAFTNQYKIALENVKTSFQSAIGVSLSLGNSISKGISAVISFAMAANMVSNAINSWGNPDISWTQKLLNTTMALGSVMGVVMTVMNGFSNSLTAITTKYGLAAGAQQLLSNKTFQTTLSYRAAAVARKALTKEQAAAELVTKFGITQAEAEAAITSMVANAKFYQAATTKEASVETVKAAGAEAMDGSASAMASAATWAYVKSKAALASQFLLTHGHIIVLIAAIAGLVAVIASLKSPLEQAQEDLNEAKENFKKVSEEAKETSNQIKELSSAWDDLANKANALDDMVEGSLEWKQALVEVNAQMLDLIDKYPELAKYIKIANGQVTMDQSGYEKYLEMQMAEAERKAGNALTAQANVTQAQAELNYQEAVKEVLPKAIKESIGEITQNSDNLIDSDVWKAIYKIPQMIQDGLLGFDANGNLIALNNSVSEEVEILSKISGIVDAIATLLNINQAGQASIEEARTNAILASNSTLFNETDYDNSIASMFYNGNESAGISSYEDRYNQLKNNPALMVGSDYLAEQYLIDKYGANWKDQGISYSNRGFGGIKITGDPDSEKAIKLSESDMRAYREQYIQQQASTMTEDDFNKIDNIQKNQRDFFESTIGLSSSTIDELLTAYNSSGKFDFQNLTSEQVEKLSSYQAMGEYKGLDWNAVQQAIDNYVKERSEANIQESAEWWANKEQNDANELQEELNEAELSSEDYEAYVDQIMEIDEAVQDYNGSEEKRRELAKEIAKDNIKTANSMKKLQKVFEDYGDEIKGDKKETFEYAKGMNAIRNELKELTGVEFSNEEIKEHLTDIEDMSNGSVEALDKIRIEAAKKIMLDVDTSGMSEGVDNAAAYLTMWADKIANTPIEQRATLDTSQFVSSLNQMLNTGAMTAEQVQSYLDNVGYSAEYSEIKKTVPGPSFGYSGYIDIDIPGFQPIDWTAYGSGSQTVTVPQIKSVNSKGVTGGGGSPNVPQEKPPSGGGGGSSKKPQKKNTSDKERYHTLTNQLEDIEKEFDAISEAAERAFGKDKLKLIDDQITKLDEEIDKQEELVEAVSANLPNDRNIMVEYYNSVFGDMNKPIEFDIRGNISNFDEIQNAMFDKWDQMAEKYTEDDEAWQVFEQKYEQFEKYLEQYEETYDKLKDEEEKQQELINQRTDLLLEQVQYALELKLNLNEDGLNLLDYQLSKIDDDAFKAAESIALIGKQADLLYQQMMIDRDGLKNILSLTIDSKSTVNQILDGEYVDLSGYNFTEDQISALKEYRDNLLDANEQMAELRDTVQEKLSDAFDAWNEKVQKGIDGIEHYGSVIEHYGNIIDTVGQEFLGITDDLMASLNQSSVDNAIANLTAVKNQYEAIESARKNAEDKLNNAKTEEDIKFWQEQLDTLTEESRNAADNVLSAWKEALSSAVSAFEASVERAMNAFNMSVYADGGLEGLGEDFERQKKLSDMYLQDYKQIYELSKLNRDINNSIDDTKSLAGKQKLKKLLEEINDIQESGLEMSEYDLEYLQAEYDLRLAEIALEEAQNAKDTVRLQKDNEGNWSYVYTSSTDAVDEAQQKYEDALYAMQDLSSNYINEMSDQLIQTSQEMAEELANLRIEDFASIDDYYTKVKEIQDSYAEEMALQEGELNKVIANNKELYDTDWTNYHNATGYKISDTEEFVTRFSDSMLGLLMGSEEESSVFADFINNAAITLTESLRQNAKSYEENVKNAMTAAGTSLEDFANQTETYLGKVKQATITAAGEVNTATGEMKQGFADLSDEIAGWQNTYGAAADSVIAKNEELINSMNKLLTALSIDEDDIMVDYTIKTVPAFSEEDIPEEASAATGGYTGDWAGNSGRLALLHKRELILDDNDTSNFVTALGLTKDILQVIDLNAKQASLAYGPMTASTLRDEATQMLEQSVHITAEFPNVQDKNEIQEAFNNLINTASQYANRK